MVWGVKVVLDMPSTAGAMKYYPKTRWQHSWYVELVLGLILIDGGCMSWRKVEMVLLMLEVSYGFSCYRVFPYSYLSFLSVLLPYE